MNIMPVVPVAQLGVGLILLLVCYKFFYQKTRLDQLREDLFTIRDDLFDYMWKNNLSYDLPAYRELRSMLNGFILFAHKFGIGGLMFGAYLSRKEERRDDIQVYINSVADPTVRCYFRQVYRRSANRIIKYVFLEGPLWLFCKPLVLGIKHLPRLHRWILKRFDRMADDAASIGTPEIKQHLLGEPATAC